MARRGRRWAISLTVILLVLVGLAIAADRVAAYAAERTIAEKVSEQQQEVGVTWAGSPDVTVGGFPFLTQVADGKYRDITIVLRDVARNGVTLPVLDIHATGVNATLDTLMSGNGTVTADRVVGTATVSYDSVRALVNQPGLELAEQGGKLRLRWPVTVSGQQVTAIATGEVSVTSGVVRLKVSDIHADGVTLPSIAQRLLDDYEQKLSIQVRLPPLPFHLTIETVRTLPEGLSITASARGVPISRDLG
jgi:hypothetical protein